MKINIKMLLLLIVLIFNCCAGNAYAALWAHLDSERYSIWSDEETLITVTVTDDQYPYGNRINGANVEIHVAPADPAVKLNVDPNYGGVICSGVTDSNGVFKGYFKGSIVTSYSSIYDSILAPVEVYAMAYYQNEETMSNDHTIGVKPKETSTNVDYEVTLTPSHIESFVGETATLTVTVLDSNGNPVTGQGVEFERSSDSSPDIISGIGLKYTDSEGKATISYSSDSVGSDTIYSHLQADDNYVRSASVVWNLKEDDTTEDDDVILPEFPNIALPIVAVIGMIAIIGRRKQ